MSRNIYSIITFASLASLLHCAYSAAQHRFYLRLTEQPFVVLPIDVVVQTLLSLVALVYGASYIPGAFQYIKKDQHFERTCDEALNCPSFITFDHRGKFLSPEYSRKNRQPIGAPACHTQATTVMEVPPNPETGSSSQELSDTDEEGSQSILLQPNLFANFSKYNWFLHSLNYCSFYSVRFYSQIPSKKTSPFSDAQEPKPDFSNLPGTRLPESSSKKVKVMEITKKQANDAFQSSLEVIRTHDVDSYLSILALPKTAQPEFIALNAFNVELALVRDKVDSRRGDTTGMYRLQFWREAISSIYGLSTLPVPRQPVAICLCLFAPSARYELLQKLIEARQSTIGDRPFKTLNSLCDYGRSTKGSLLVLQMDALARQNNVAVGCEMEKVALELGAAYGIVNLIRSTLPLLSRGIVLLPSELMTLHGITPDSVYKKKKTAETKALIKDMAMEASRILASAREQTTVVPRQLRQVLAATAASVDHTISQINKSDFDVYSAHLQRRNPIILWTLLTRKITGNF